MKQSIRNMAAILAVLLVGATAQAELKLVVNFDSLTGNPDGQACNGVLGGTMDTESDATGNSSLPTVDGSVAMAVIGHSSGTLARAIGLNGINQPDRQQRNRDRFLPVHDGYGRHRASPHGPDCRCGNNPVNAHTDGDPKTIPAGFRLVDNGTGFDMATLDGATVLKTGLARSQWYNVWIVADNAADTFDLYLSEADGSGRAGDAAEGRRTSSRAALPFAVATADPLNGMIFANPISPTGSGQATRIHVDEIWWDGDQGLSKSTTAKNPSPADKAQDVSRDVILSWTAAGSVSCHARCLLRDQPGRRRRGRRRCNPLGVLASQGQDANTFDPAGLLDLGRTYYWRVDEVNSAAGPDRVQRQRLVLHRRAGRLPDREGHGHRVELHRRTWDRRRPSTARA